MKTKLILAVVASLLCALPLSAQVSTMSKKACQQTMAGIWQIEGKARNGEKVYGPIYKVYRKNGEYQFLTSLGTPMGKTRIMHEGKWRVVKPGLLEENTTFRSDREGGKGEKAVVEFEIIDYNHMSITWQTDDGRKSTEYYSRVIY